MGLLSLHRRSLRNFTFATVALFISGNGSAALRYPKLSREGLEQLRSISAAILEKCPPTECLPVFFGRSSILISAYLEAKSKTPLALLPLSGVARLTTAEMKTAQDNFEKNVLIPLLDPILKQQNPKRILFIDFSSTGWSIARFGEWLSDHLARNRNFEAISLGAFSYGGSVGSEASAHLARFRIPLTEYAFPSNVEGTVQYLARESLLEPYAPFDAYYPANDRQPPTIESGRRMRYPYRDGHVEVTSYGSYADLVEWLENPKLADDLPTQHTLRCQSYLQSPGGYGSFSN